MVTMQVSLGILEGLDASWTFWMVGLGLISL